jgi:hypothetical protein
VRVPPVRYPTLANQMRRDEENSALFNFAKEQVISHASNDDLDGLSISMTPDRVVGLRSPVRIPHDANFFPVTGREILLPFLIIEAKKELHAPGFRAIQCQTAFAVRRLLLAQQSLLKNNQSGEPCLIWFFAFQGEQWRLQICTYDESRTPVVSFLHASLFSCPNQNSRRSTICGKGQSNVKMMRCNFC